MNLTIFLNFKRSFIWQFPLESCAATVPIRYGTTVHHSQILFVALVAPYRIGSVSTQYRASPHTYWYRIDLSKKFWRLKFSKSGNDARVKIFWYNLPNVRALRGTLYSVNRYSTVRSYVPYFDEYDWLYGLNQIQKANHIHRKILLGVTCNTRAIFDLETSKAKFIHVKKVRTYYRI